MEFKETFDDLMILLINLKRNSKSIEFVRLLIKSGFTCTSVATTEEDNNDMLCNNNNDNDTTNIYNNNNNNNNFTNNSKLINQISRILFNQTLSNHLIFIKWNIHEKQLKLFIDIVLIDEELNPYFDYKNMNLIITQFINEVSYSFNNLLILFDNEFTFIIKLFYLYHVFIIIN